MFPLPIKWLPRDDARSPLYMTRKADMEKSKTMGTGHFYRSDLPPGSAQWSFWSGTRGQFGFICPCGCGMLCGTPVYAPEDDTKYGWVLEGPLWRPTFRPSIQLLGTCRWHGFMVKGCFSMDPPP